MNRPRGCLTLLLIVAMSACAGPPPTGVGGGANQPRTSKGAAPSAPISPVPGAPASPLAPGLPSGAPGLGASPGAPSPFLANPFASLVGRVKAPAGVLSNNGAGLISDKGGSIVSNNGAGIVSNNGSGYALARGYRLRQVTAALEQFYVPDALVELIDAEGRAILGADGAPLTTKTGPDGAYAFTAPLPAQALVVRVTPPGAGGALSRLLVRGVRSADVDLSSALVAGYVLAKYVDRQPDRQGTLEKLPADVEAETVTRAQAALAGGALAAGGLPTTLQPGAVLAAAEALRRADAGFDTQMETVRKILIAAGVPGLGAGMRATELFFRRFNAFHVPPEGGFYGFSPYERVLWGVAADGTVAHVAGRSGLPAADEPVSRAGHKAREVALEEVIAMRRDEQGRLMVAELRHGVWRIEADGRIAELTPAASLAALTSPLRAGEATLRRDGTLVWARGGSLQALPPGGTITPLMSTGGVTGTHVVELSANRWLVGDHRGMGILEAGKAPVTQWARTDIPDYIPGGNLLEVRSPWIDEAGNVFYEAAGALHVVAPDGAERVIAPASAMKQFMHQGWVGADGALYLVDDLPQDAVSNALVWRFATAGATPTLVAGRPDMAPGFLPGGVLPLLRPEDMDVAADGTIFVADGGAVIKVRPGGAAEVVLARDATLPGAPEPLRFTGVRVAPGGKLVVRALGTDRELVFRQTDAGWDLPVVVPEEWVNQISVATMAWDVAADGTIFVSFNDILTTGDGGDAHTGRVLRARPGDATATDFVGAASGVGWITKLAVQPDGSLRLAAEQWRKKAIGADFFIDESFPGRWAVSPAGAVSPLAPDALVPEAFDATGHGYAGDIEGFQAGNVGDRRIRRLRPDGTAEVVAGQPGGLLGGDALDDSIGEASGLAFDAAGNLYVRDEVRRQIRRIARGSF